MIESLVMINERLTVASHLEVSLYDHSPRDQVQLQITSKHKEIFIDQIR